MRETETDITYKELRPLNAWDVAANECWLEDMARQGYHLTDFKRYSGVFEKGEPGHWRYRMQLSAKKETESSPERIAANEQRGWTYVATWDYFHIWKSEQMAAWLDPAPGVTAEDFARLRRRLIGASIGYILLLAGMVALTVWIPLHSPTPLWSTVYGGAAGGSILIFLVELSAVILLLRELSVGLRLLRTFEAREPLERPGDYRRQKRTARLSFVLGMLFMLFGVLGDLWEDPWSAREKGGEEPKAGAVYVDLRVMDGIPEEETYFFAPKTKVHELAPRMWFIKQYANSDAPTEQQIMAHSEYYRLLTDVLRPELERELIYRYDAEMTAVECEMLDSFFWSEETHDDLRTQLVIASVGREVLLVSYRGPTDLRTQEAYFANLLSN